MHLYLTPASKHRATCFKIVHIIDKSYQFMSSTKKIWQRCHTSIQLTYPDHSHHTIGPAYSPYRQASCACSHKRHCFKILFPAIDPYASSLVVLQSLMEYSTHLFWVFEAFLPPLHWINTSTFPSSYSAVHGLHQHRQNYLKPDLVEPCSEASYRYELLSQYHISNLCDFPISIAHFTSLSSFIVPVSTQPSVNDFDEIAITVNELS